jgi:MraZ protein
VKSGEVLPGPTAQTAERAPASVRVGFCGTYQHSVDVKGRVAVPAQLRRGLPDGSVVAQGPDHRLMIWPPDAWERELDRFRRTAETPAQGRRFIRMLQGNAYPFEADAQGRLLLTPSHRTWAQIEDGATFVGVGEAIELSGDAVWQSDRLDLDPDEFTRLHDLVRHAGEGTST